MERRSKVDTLRTLAEMADAATAAEVQRVSTETGVTNNPENPLFQGEIYIEPHRQVWKTTTLPVQISNYHAVHCSFR